MTFTPPIAALTALLLTLLTPAVAPFAAAQRQSEPAEEMRAAGQGPLRPGEAPAALASRAAEFFQFARERQWEGAAAMVSEQSHHLFSIPDGALPEIVLTHITFNPGKILQLELTGNSWFHLSPVRRPPGDEGPDLPAIFQMEILLLDDDYYPELTLLWAVEDQEWRLLSDDNYRHYLSLNIPGDARGRCTRFMSLLRHAQWAEAAEMISSRTAQLPFSPPVEGHKDLIQSLTCVPGKRTFKEFVLTFDRNSWCEIGQYNTAQGWFEMRLHRLSSGEDRLSLIWVLEQDGNWKAYCDADYLRYLDLESVEHIPPGLRETVERYFVNFCRGFNRQWWDAWSDNSLWKAFDLGTEMLQALVPFAEFATFPDPLPVPRFNIKYRHIAGFARRDGGLLEVVVYLRGGGPGVRMEAPTTSLWVQTDSGWQRTTAEAEQVKPPPPSIDH